MLSCSQFSCVVVSWLWRAVAVELCRRPFRDVAVCSLGSLQRSFSCSGGRLLPHDIVGSRLVLLWVVLGYSHCGRLFRSVADLLLGLLLALMGGLQVSGAVVPWV